MISFLSIVYFLICGLICLILPIAVITYMLKLRYGEKSPAAAGLLCYLVFVVVAKHYFDRFFFGITGLGVNPWVYGILSGLTAVVFELLARIAGFRLFMPKNHEDERQNGVLFGAGYAGLDIMIGIGANMLVYFVFSLLFNNRPEFLLTGQNGAQWEEIRQFLMGFSPWTSVWLTVEAVSRFVLQIAISVLIFAAIQLKNYRYLLLTVGFQWACSSFVTLANSVAPVVLMECLLAVAAVLASRIAFEAYERCRKNPIKPTRRQTRR